jgi:hypothetical protein
MVLHGKEGVKIGQLFLGSDWAIGVDVGRNDVILLGVSK